MLTDIVAIEFSEDLYKSPLSDLTSYVATIPDPRLQRNRKHELTDIVMLSLLATICGADGYIAIEHYGQARYDWLKDVLKLPNGIPSHDTIERVIGMLDPKAFAKALYGFVTALAGSKPRSDAELNVLAIDGKTLRGSFDRAATQSPLHLLNAWSTSTQTVIGHLAIPDKTNEITALPQLLEMLDIRGRVVTADAMHCQKESLSCIKKKKADYVVAVKGNQPHLFETIKAHYAYADKRCADGQMHDVYGEAFCAGHHQSIDKAHGRIEVRTVDVYRAGTWLHSKCSGWESVQCVARVSSQRHILSTDKKTDETRYFISSVAPEATKLADMIRAHWGVENCLHYTLDCTFGEDKSRVRKNHGPENLGTLKRVAVGVLRNERSTKVGAPTKRLRAAWNNGYLLKSLSI